jgi:hypothetical protein
MSTETVPYSPPSQPAAPGVELYTAAAPTAAASVPIAGTNTGAGSVLSTPPSIIPIATPAPAVAPGSVPVATPAQPAVPALAPVTTPDGQSLPSPVTQEQLAATVAQVNAKIAAGTAPILTRPDGSKIELTIDENNNLGEEPAPQS